MNVQNNTSNSDWTFQTEEEIQAEQNALQLTTDNTGVLVFSDASPMIMKLDPARLIEFYNDNKTVGTLDFSTGELKFIGNADASALALFEALKPYLTQFFYDQKQQFMHDANDFMNKLHGQPRG